MDVLYFCLYICNISTHLRLMKTHAKCVEVLQIYKQKWRTSINETIFKYSRYILCDIKKNQIDTKLDEINNIHPLLKFTEECEKGFINSFSGHENSSYSYQRRLTSTWYTKSKNTSLMMGFHATAPVRYKRFVVSGLVHRIFCACSNLFYFNGSLNKAKEFLENNQYPKAFYNPIIWNTVKILEKWSESVNENNEEEEKEEEVENKLIFLAYWGKVSEKFESSLRRIKVPVKVLFVLKNSSSFVETTCWEAI